MRDVMPHDLDREVAEALELLEYDVEHERTGQYRILCWTESEAREVRVRLTDALRQSYPDLSYSVKEWMIESWPLADVCWADYGEDTPMGEDGTAYPFAVVVACPWRLGGCEDFEELVDRLLEDYGVESGRADRERHWWIRYESADAADPAALIRSPRNTLGWWECYGLEFHGVRSGATVTIEIRS